MQLFLVIVSSNFFYITVVLVVCLWLMYSLFLYDFTLSSSIYFIWLLCHFQECYLENDTSVLYHVTNSLMTLQALYGLIPKIYGKGELSRVS